MVAARYRERHGVPRTKSDHVDAMTLANIPRTDARAYQPAVGGPGIAVLSRTTQDAI